MIPMPKIIAKARLLGINNAETIERGDLIRAIQVKEGYTPCYGTDWCKPEWKDECKANMFT